MTTQLIVEIRIANLPGTMPDIKAAPSPRDRNTDSGRAEDPPLPQREGLEASD